MKRLLIIFLLPVMLLTFLPTPALANTVVNFPDPGLQAAIRQAINKPTGDIYDTDLVPLTTLYASLKGISNLSGLEYCTNLQTLNLNSNNITDISAIAYLTNLQWLTLDGNNIADISAIAYLTNLQNLSLSSNHQLSNISALANLTKLRMLWIETDQISNISALANLINLQFLSLYNNQISDISVLANLTSLRDLALSFNPIGDISSLANLTNLNRLVAQNNGINNISALANLTNLQYLEIWRNQIASIADLANLTNLRNLALSSNQIADISVLANMTNLQSLWLDSNKIADISALVTNAGLSTGDTISVQNNYLDLTAGSQNTADIQTLINRGVSVTYQPQKQFILPVNINGHGTVAKSPDQTGYYYGMLVQLTATPAAGWSFIGWRGDVSGSTNPVTIVMNGNRSVTATFTQDQYTLGITTVGSGSASKNPNQATYVYGTSVQLTATATAGWSFTGWSGDVSGSTNPVTITMNGNKSVTANFVGLPSILVSPVTYSFGNVKVGTSSSGIVTITNTGYTNLSVTISTLSPPFSYTVSGDLSQIAPNDTRWITVTYQPTSAVSSTATLSITSNDPNNPLVGVQLSGTGVPAVVPPAQQITDILAFFDQSVANGTLVGSGPGNSASGRLNALRNMIQAAGDLINQGRTTEARQQLQDAYLKVDGNPKPPDFVTGTAAAQLASMIQQLINSL